MSHRGCGRRCDLEIVQQTSISYAVCALDVHRDALTDLLHDARLPCETQYVLAPSLAETLLNGTFLGTHAFVRARASASRSRAHELST
eukprot:2814804-Pleurochrysis_carterae.AAC.1